MAKLCKKCGKEMSENYTEEICGYCLKKSSDTSKRVCKKCGRNLPENSTKKICGSCSLKRKDMVKGIALTATTVSLATAAAWNKIPKSLKDTTKKVAKSAIKMIVK